jgi:hypothetical protein
VVARANTISTASAPADRPVKPVGLTPGVVTMVAPDAAVDPGWAWAASERS